MLDVSGRLGNPAWTADAGAAALAEVAALMVAAATAAAAASAADTGSTSEKPSEDSALRTRAKVLGFPTILRYEPQLSSNASHSGVKLFNSLGWFWYLNFGNT